MSHFSLAVHIPAGNDNLVCPEYVGQILMPWHEYESTGIENEYVKQIEIVDALNGYIKTHNAYMDPSKNGYQKYRFPWTLRDDELIYRSLTEEEAKQADDGTYQFKEREIRFTRKERHAETGVLMVPESYEPVRAAICHTYTIPEYIQDEYNITNVIYDKNNIPATGPYVLITPGTDIGPFDISIPTQIVKDTLSKNVHVFAYTNPDAKWDWWEIAGRFTFYNTKGEHCSTCKVKDFVLYTPDGEEHIPYAYIKDGQWHEPGKMGWFGCSSATENSQKEYDQSFRSMIASCNPEDWLVCVDCHI